MEGLFNIDWNRLTYSSFSSLMCCFLMVTTIWDNPRNTIKNAFNSLFEGLKNKMHEQHAQLTHLNPAKKMEHIEYMDGKYEEMACLLENDLEKALKIYKYAAVVACMLATFFLYIGKTDYLGRVNAYLLFPIFISIFWMFVAYLIRRYKLKKCYHTVEEHGKFENSIAETHALQRE